MSATSVFFDRQRSAVRIPLAIAALTSALGHVPVIAPHLDEVPYMGVLFVVLTTACSILAVAALTYDAPVLYAAAATTCGLAIFGYAAMRVVAFPQLADDVGNWFEPLGVVSIASESIVVILALVVLRKLVHDRSRRVRS